MNASPALPRRIGLTLAAVQFFFALSWTVYVIFLPQLAAQAGIPASALPTLLMLDQLVFLVSDALVGVMSDRAAQVVGRLGPAVLAATLLSCAAFVALPFVAPRASPAWFVALTAVWAVTSSALRAPPLTLIGRHAARPSQPGLLALTLLGLGVAGALAPYLSLRLRELDPRLPFVLSSLALAAATVGLVAAERLLARAGRSAAAAAAPAPRAGVPASAWGLFAAALAAALAFQGHVFVNSAPLYLRHAGSADLAYLLPVFWVGFNLGLLPASAATRRFGGLRVMGVSAAVAATAAVFAQQAPNLAALLAAQAVAGAAWAGVLMSAFAAALALGHTGREGTLAGGLSSLLAMAALVRIAGVAAQWPASPAGRIGMPWLVAAGWLLAGGLLAVLAWRHRTAPPGARANATIQPP